MRQPEEVVHGLLSSGLKGDLVVLFRKNPGIMDTRESIARRLGASVTEIEKEISELINLGFLKAEQVGKYEVISLDDDNDKVIQELVGTYLASSKQREDVSK